jgi:hypothetical protein
VNSDSGDNDPDDKAFMRDFFCDGKARQFADGDLVAGLECFVNCLDEGIQPPDEVLRWIQGGIREYLSTDGKADIAGALGLKRKGEMGRGTIITRRKTSALSYYYASVMNILIHGLGASIAEAAEMVAARDASNGRGAPSSSWLEEQYRKEWKPKKIGGLNETLDRFDTDDKKTSFLGTFPEYSIPHRLKNR